VLQTARGGHVLHQPAGRAHLGGACPPATTRSRPHHQHEGRAARRRRALSGGSTVIVGDSNMSEYANFLKVGATSILLRMPRGPGRRAPRHDAREPDPCHSARSATTPPCRRRVRLANGREASALDIQGEYLLRGAALCRAEGARPRLEKQALEMWEHCLEGIEKDPFLARPRMRLGDQAPPDRALPASATASRCPTPEWRYSTSSTTT